MVEYTIYDRRRGDLVGRSVQPDASVKSERDALRAVGFATDTEFAEFETREISDDACRPWVGRRYGDAR